MWLLSKSAFISRNPDYVGDIDNGGDMFYDYEEVFDLKVRQLHSVSWLIHHCNEGTFLFPPDNKSQLFKKFWTQRDLLQRFHREDN